MGNGRQAGALRDDDVVIVGMARTAMTRAKRGAQANTPLEDMLKVALEGAIAMSKIPADKVDEVIVGNVLAPGSAASQIRMAMFLAGIPHRASCQGINRMCSSGLQSVASIANAIKAGDIEIGIGGGVESMSNFNMMGAVDANFLSDAVFESETARNCLIPMGVTSENVAEKFGVTRDTQDAFAVTSHAKATAADKAGWLQSEITPYTTTVKDKEGEMQEVRVDRDDGMRPQTTVESLGKLKPAFKKGGSSTAGNSSQMTDGLLASCSPDVMSPRSSEPPLWAVSSASRPTVSPQRSWELAPQSPSPMRSRRPVSPLTTWMSSRSMRLLPARPATAL